MEDIQQFAQQVKDKYGLETFDLETDRAGNIELVMIQAPRDSRQQGAGTAVMKALTDYADRTGQLIWLSVADRDSKTGTTSRGRLVKFYRQFGFIPNKGRNKRFDLSMYVHMYRDPKGLQEEINMILRRAGVTELSEDTSAASPITHFERGELACGEDPKRCLTSSPGEAGDGVYAMIPNARMRAHYTKDGEALVSIDMKPGKFVIDLTQPSKLQHLIDFTKEEIERTAKQMGGYYQKPKINQSTVQRFGRIITDYMRKFHPDASGWIVHHKGPGIPTGKQVVLPDPDAYEVELLRPKRGYSEEINDIRRRAGLPIMEAQYPKTMTADDVFDHVVDIHHTPEDIDDGDIYERIQAYGMYHLTEVPISAVDLGEWEVDDSMVSNYAKQTQQTPDYPPIVYDPIAKSIIDGMHRANALHQLGSKTIRAYVGDPKTARSWDEINSLLGLDDIEDEDE